MGNARDTHPSDNAPLKPGKLPGPLLARLINAYRTPPDESVIVAPAYGSDAAAVTVGGDTLIVKSDPITFASDAAARYLVAVNANDVACLGGIPRWMTVVALLPPDSTTEATVEHLFAELQQACGEHGIGIIGGHTEVTSGLDRPILVGTLLGTTGPAGILRPGSARSGDDLYVTKWAGIEGTALLAQELADSLTPSLGDQVVRRATKLLRSPGISVVADASALLSTGGVRALHDPTEGGIATAIHELAEASSLGAEVIRDAIPVLPETRSICDHLGLDPLGLLSSGALLVAGDPSHRRDIETAATHTAIPLSRIGRLCDRDDGIMLVGTTGAQPLPRFDADEVTRIL